MEADEKLKFKKSIFKAALDTAVQGHADGVPGFVLGDLNIDVQHVKEMLKEYVIEIHAVGGQGGVCHFKSICTNCTAVLGAEPSHTPFPRGLLRRMDSSRRCFDALEMQMRRQSHEERFQEHGE